MKCKLYNSLICTINIETDGNKELERSRNILKTVLNFPWKTFEHNKCDQTSDLFNCPLFGCTEI